MTEISMKNRPIGADISASSTRRRRREDEGAATGDEWTSIAVRRGRVVGFASDSRRIYVDGCRCVHLTSHDSIASGSASVRAMDATDRPTERGATRPSARTREGMTASSVDFCHLPRDLSVGDVGGDVHCLQRAQTRRIFKRRAERKIRRGDARGGETMDDGERVEHRTGSVDASVRSAYAEVRARRGDLRSFVVFRRGED